MRHARSFTLGIGALAALLALPTCSTDTRGLGLGEPGASGGRTSTGTGGGVEGTGGATASTGGFTGAGGSIHSGGSPGTGATTGSGGSPGAAGRSGTGGSSGPAGTGGSPGTGGSLATGGLSGIGGRMGRGGGAPATGGQVGTGGRGVGGSGARAPECVTASDCRLYSDCCTCRAVPVGGPNPPLCPLLCIQSKCGQLQLPPGAVDCVAGRCVAGFNCDDSDVSCDIAVPGCPAGEAPVVNASGSCYLGGCAPATQCKRVASCGVCSASGADGDQACVSYQTRGGEENHCVTVPAVCQGGAASCACLGPSSCISPYSLCSPASSNDRGVRCSCPTC